FSSRRRHTRVSRDWSSDVCPSDLELGIIGVRGLRAFGTGHDREVGGQGEALGVGHWGNLSPEAPSLNSSSLRGAVGPAAIQSVRSEERRVGNERRSGWPPKR